jgi:hypothetical protein
MESCFIGRIYKLDLVIIIKLACDHKAGLSQSFRLISYSILPFQDLLEVTPVSHVDRVPLQLALTQLECLAELINSRRKEGEMKSQLKYLDTQISQLSKVKVSRTKLNGEPQ